METDEHDSPMKMKHSTTYYDSPKTSLLFAAQSRSFGCRARKQQQQKKVAVNPFVPRVQSLEKDTCSPTLFVIGKSPKSEEFSWTIDDISKIQPADIDSPQYVEFEYDEKTETKAQEVIERYFSETHSAVSPMDWKIGNFDSPSESTPAVKKQKLWSSSPAVSSTPCAKFSEKRRLIKVDACEQTDLSLPPVLPPEIEAILKPYFRPQNFELLENDENNMNNSTLRRKLFFDKQEELISPVKCSLAPSPVPDYSMKASRLNWSHSKKSGSLDDLSTPDLSPINIDSSRSFSDSVNPQQEESKTTKDDLLALPLGKEPKRHAIFNSTTKISQSISSMCQDTGYSTIGDNIHQ